ncbi:MAG: hypothetical protein WAX07_06515 [Candidatus Altiarchaeia archaeon]
MKKKHIATLAGVLLIGIVLFAWIQETAPPIVSPQNPGYKIVSLIDYDKNLCSSVISHGELNGFDTGSNIILKDNESGQKLNGSVLISMGNSASGGGADTGYSCEENTSSGKAVISAYSAGYASGVFELDLPKDKLATVEILMAKGCSGATACIDKLKIGLLERAGGNQTKADEMLKSSQEQFYEIIQRNYGLEKTDYELTCTECDLGRGGFIKAKGNYMDGTPMEIYYHRGWCSSGGTDCGWSKCFATENEKLFASVKNMSCNRLSVYTREEDTSVPGVMSMTTVEDLTNETIKECMNGKYDEDRGKMKAFSIIQNANRYATSVEKGDVDCMDN